MIYNLQLNLRNMKIFIVVLFITLSSSQNVVLVQSGVSSTTITSPLSQTVGINNYHTVNLPNYLGSDAQWIWNNINSDFVPNGQTLTFQALFYSDCQSVPATLTVTADNNFTAYINNATVGSGSNWTTRFTFPIKLICGLNNLTVVATNLGERTPAAVIFSINQTQESCYKCADNGYYNRDTCNCSCLQQCPCLNKLSQWKDYPTCACKCLYPVQCVSPLYYNWQTCSCQCKPIYCAPGYYQDKNTCVCVKKCTQTYDCDYNRIWNEVSCSCLCKKIVCPPRVLFDYIACKCLLKFPQFPFA